MTGEPGPSGQASPQAVLEEADIICSSGGAMRLTAEFEAAMGVYHDSYIDLEEREYQRSVAEEFAIDPQEVAEVIDRLGVTREQFIAYLAISAQLGREVSITERAEMAMLVTQCAPSTPVPDEMVMLDDETYETYLRDHSQTVVFVWRRFCEPCDRMKRELESESSVFPPDVAVAGLDGEATPTFRRAFNIDVAPSVLLFRGSTCERTLTGYHSSDAIADACAAVYADG